MRSGIKAYQRGVSMASAWRSIISTVPWRSGINGGIGGGGERINEKSAYRNSNQQRRNSAISARRASWRKLYGVARQYRRLASANSAISARMA